jgi:hypothetical protein
VHRLDAVLHSDADERHRIDIGTERVHAIVDTEDFTPSLANAIDDVIGNLELIYTSDLAEGEPSYLQRASDPKVADLAAVSAAGASTDSSSR